MNDDKLLHPSWQGGRFVLLITTEDQRPTHHHRLKYFHSQPPHQQLLVFVIYVLAQARGLVGMCLVSCTHLPREVGVGR